MALYLGILIFSFILTGIAIVPFIDFLYRLKFTSRDEKSAALTTDSRQFAQLARILARKAGTPIGGGVLIIAMVAFVFALVYPLLGRLGVYITSNLPVKQELNVIFFTFISFGLLGLYDDIIKIFRLPQAGVFGLRLPHKLVAQTILAVTVAAMLYFNLGISIVNIPFWGVLKLGWLYLPLAAFVILAFANAYDITDGLDGLSTGILLVCLLAFWTLSVASLDTALSTFLALWIGALISFLYFNVYPARIWLGNAGGLAFGATLAVIGLLLGKTVALLVIGGIFVVEAASSLAQILWFKFTGRRLLPVAPLHHLLLIRGWPEPKIVMRAWLVAIMLAIFGLWLAQL